MKHADPTVPVFVGLAAPAALVALFLGVQPASAQGGHGPSFGLATPTGGKGAVSYDITAMSFGAGGGAPVMLRHTWKYGLTERLQLNLSFPTPINRAEDPPRTRGGSLMPGFGDLELSGLWRFHKNDLGVGSRFESTLVLGASHPTEERRAGIRVGNGFHIAAVTGYASRTVYAWFGGGSQRFTSRNADRLGSVDYVTGVLGWRPPLFREDYPRPDWRIFVEAVGERAARNRRDGEAVEASGGDKLLLGPSVLGLYGAWGLSAGLLFSVYESLRDPAGDEPIRIVLNLSYWF